MSSLASVVDAAAELGVRFTGLLLKPVDAGYEEARRIHNGLVDKRPALIARCRGVADVVDAVSLTKKVGARSGGPRRGSQCGRARDHRWRGDDRPRADEGYPCRSQGADR